MKKHWVTVLVICILLIFLLQGCLYQAINPRMTDAEWYQSGIWEEFPKSQRFGGFSIFVDEDVETKRISAYKDDRYTRESFSVSNDDKIRYLVSTKLHELSNDEAWDRMLSAFIALGLDEPALNQEYRFTYRPADTLAEWNQFEVWDEFPLEAGINGYDILHHESLKVAQRIESNTSEWLLVTDQGEVKYEFLFRGTVESDPQYSAGNWSKEIWSNLQLTFDALALPEPTLNPEYVFPF